MKKSLALLPLLALFAVGCSKPGLEGKWTMTGGSMAKSQATGTITYTGNKFSLEMEIPQVSLKLIAKGTYKLEADKLTQTTEEVVIDDSKVAPQMKAMIKAVATPESVKKQMNADNSSTVKFTDADNVLLNGGKDGDVTLVRVKSS